MNDWKQLFKPHILERGYEYYRDNAVEEITKRGNTYFATVCGSEEYEVEITVKKDTVNSCIAIAHMLKSTTVNTWRQCYMNW